MSAASGSPTQNRTSVEPAFITRGRQIEEAMDLFAPPPELAPEPAPITQPVEPPEPSDPV